jgi:hypothetical protein
MEGWHNPHPPTARQAAEIAVEIALAKSDDAPEPRPDEDEWPTREDFVGNLRWAMRWLQDRVRQGFLDQDTATSLCQAALRTIRCLEQHPDWKRY